MLFVGIGTVGVSEIVAVTGAPFRLTVCGVIAIVYPEIVIGGYIDSVTGLGVCVNGVTVTCALPACPATGTMVSPPVGDRLKSGMLTVIVSPAVDDDE